VIRQAISCDLCGAEKKQTNHWFVAYNHGGELRVCGFNPRTRLRVGSKHLCGQACLHKLIAEFISTVLSGRVLSHVVETTETVEPPVTTDASLTSKAAYRGLDAAQKPMVQPTPISPQRNATPISTAVVAMQPRLLADQPRTITAHPSMAETPNYASRHWRAEAWEREREREMHSIEPRHDSVSRHRKSS